MLLLIVSLAHAANGVTPSTYSSLTLSELLLTLPFALVVAFAFPVVTSKLQARERS